MTDTAPDLNGGHAVSKPRKGAFTRLGSLQPVATRIWCAAFQPGKKGASKRLGPLQPVHAA